MFASTMTVQGVTGLVIAKGESHAVIKDDGGMYVRCVESAGCWYLWEFYADCHKANEAGWYDDYLAAAG